MQNHTNGNWFVGCFEIEPAMVLKYFRYVCCCVNLNIVSGLFNIDAIEAFDDSKVIEWVGHMLLYSCSEFFTCLEVACH